VSGSLDAPKTNIQRRHIPGFVQQHHYDSTEEYFDNYITDAIKYEKKKSNNKPLEEQKLQEELDMLDEQLQYEEHIEGKTESPKKPRVAKNFHKMVSYRTEGAFADKFSELNNSPKKNKSKQFGKIPYLIWVDPETRRFFKLNMATFKGWYLEVPNEELDRLLGERISNTLRTTKKICKYQWITYLGDSAEDRMFYWKYKEQAEYFRRRKLVREHLISSTSRRKSLSKTFEKWEIPFKYHCFLQI
jgi:hypothetical protein